jgi:hypothetical protein
MHRCGDMEDAMRPSFVEEIEAQTPRWQAVGFGLVLLAASLTAAWRGLQINIAFAVSEGVQTDFVWVYASADVLECALPLALGLGAAAMPFALKSGVRGLWVICILTSCYCILATSSEIEAKRMHAEGVVKKNYDAAHARGDKATATLEQPDVAKEHDDLATLEVLAGEAKAAADREGARSMCGKKCEDAHTEHRKLLERIGHAKARDHAQAELRDVQPVLSRGVASPPGIAVILSSPTGISVETLSRSHTVIKTVAPLFLIKFAVWILTPAASWFLFICGKVRRAKLATDAREPSKEVAVIAPVDEACEGKIAPPISDKSVAAILTTNDEEKYVPDTITEDVDAPARAKAVEPAQKLLPAPRQKLPKNVVELHPSTKDTKPGGEVRDFLREFLADGKKSGTSVKQAAAERGFTTGQLYRARAAMGIDTSEKVGRAQAWALPKKGSRTVRL